MNNNRMSLPYYVKIIFEPRLFIQDININEVFKIEAGMKVWRDKKESTIFLYK